MQKLKLDLESLAVETFETVGEGTSSGTAQQFDYTRETSGGPYHCPYFCEPASRLC